MPRKLTERQFLALAYLDTSDRVAPRDLPMRAYTARAVLAGVTRKGYAAEAVYGTYKITDAGRAALATAREEARREAGIS